MRILLANPWDHAFGGVASVVGYLARYLRDQGHEVFFLLPGDRDSLKTMTTKWGFPGFELRLRSAFRPRRPVRSVAAFWFLLPRTLQQLARLLRGQRIDIVNLHYPTDDFVHLSLCRRLLPIKLVTSVHGADLFPDGQRRKRYSRSLRSLLSSSDLVVAASHGFLGDCLSVFPDLESRSRVIHNGLDLAELERNSEEPSRSPRERRLLCIAVHRHKKGLDVLLRAFAELNDLDPPRKLILVGDGPLRGELEQLADSLGLRDRVSFLGELPRAELVDLLQSCEAVVLPSRSEPFGIAAIEAMACRKPLVASAVGGILEIVEHGRNGILVEPEDPKALAGALRELLANSTLQAALGAEGYRTVRDRFRYEMMGAAYEREFTRLLSAS